MRPSKDTPGRWVNNNYCWYQDGNFKNTGAKHDLDLNSEVYVSDTPPPLITVRTGSSGGGGGMTPDTPRVGFAPPDQRQTADAPAPEAKTLRDEFAMAALPVAYQSFNDERVRGGLVFNAADVAERAYQFATAMMEARKK
jgi:hypothetical protein